MRPIALRFLVGTLLFGSAAAGVTTSLAATSADAAATRAASQAAAPTVAEALAATPSLSTLRAAVDAAGLGNALNDAKELTIFAPTNAAFEALGEATVAKLLKPENIARLTAVLTYHVVPKEVAASDAIGARTLDTLNGQRVDVSVKSGQLVIDNAKVVMADVAVRNGVVHIIDAVLIPSDRDLVATLDKADHFDTLLKAASAVGLAEFLGEPGPYTVLAPTDEAFAKLPKGTVASLLKPESKETLQAILKLHVIPGRIYADAAAKAGSAETLNGERVTFSLAKGSLMVNGARIVRTDIEAKNGVIHAIDSVLLPSAAPKPAEAKAMTAAACSSDARSIALLAIERGVPIFNRGEYEGCAAIYEVAVRSIASDQALSAPVREALHTALWKAEAATRPSEQAWILRAGLDRVLEAMTTETMTAAEQ